MLWPCIIIAINWRIGYHNTHSALPGTKYLCPCWCAAADLVCSVCQIVSSLCCRGRGWPGLFLPGWPLVGAMLWPVFCIYTSWQLFASDQRSVVGQWTGTGPGPAPDTDHIDIHLYFLYSLLHPDPWYGNKQCYCWYVVWMGMSLWLWCMTSSSWSGINHISTFINSMISCY